jgi:hypothetical protein
MVENNSDNCEKKFHVYFNSKTFNVHKPEQTQVFLTACFLLTWYKIAPYMGWDQHVGFHVKSNIMVCWYSNQIVVNFGVFCLQYFGLSV